MCVYKMLVFSGISFQDYVYSTCLVCLVSKCHRLLLHYNLYAVLSAASCVRLVKPFASFSGSSVWEKFVGSEAFLLGTCPAG